MQSVPGSLGPGVEGSLGQKGDGRRCWKVGVQRKWAPYCCPGLDKPTAGQPLGALCSVPLQAILRRQHKRRRCPHRPEVLATGFPPCGPLPPLGSALFSLQRLLGYLGIWEPLGVEPRGAKTREDPDPNASPFCGHHDDCLHGGVVWMVGSPLPPSCSDSAKDRVGLCTDATPTFAPHFQ